MSFMELIFLLHIFALVNIKSKMAEPEVNTEESKEDNLRFCNNDKG